MDQYKDLIRKYASQLGIELTGDFNVITVVNNLPTQFFDDDRKQRLKDAISDQDFATFSDIFVAPLNVVEDDTPKSQTEDYIIKVAQDLGISEDAANEFSEEIGCCLKKKIRFYTIKCSKYEIKI